MATLLEKIWENSKCWKSFAIEEDRMVGMIQIKFNLDYTVENEFEIRTFLTSKEAHNLTRDILTDFDGKNQIVEFEASKANAKRIEIKRLVMAINVKCGSLT